MQTRTQGSDQNAWSSSAHGTFRSQVASLQRMLRRWQGKQVEDRLGGDNPPLKLLSLVFMIASTLA